MSATPNRTLEVKGVNIRIAERAEHDFLSLTDMASQSTRPALVIANWIRNKDTLEFLGLWEQLFTPAFKLFEFEDLMSQTAKKPEH